MAANLDRAIRVSGKTNREVGEAIGVTEHQVWRWRHGRSHPRQQYLMALVDLLFEGEIARIYQVPPLPPGRKAPRRAA